MFWIMIMLYNIRLKKNGSPPKFINYGKSNKSSVLFLNLLYIIPLCSHSSFSSLTVTLFLLVNSSALSKPLFENPFCSQILWAQHFLDSIQVSSCSTYSVPGLFHLWSPVSTILPQMMGFHFYVWLNAIPLYNYASIFSINQFMDTLVISISWWLWTVRKWTWEVRCPF